MHSPPLPLQLEQALATWPQWQAKLTSPPLVECELAGGLCNRSWLLATTAGHCVVRLNSVKDSVFNVDRRREAVVLNGLSGEDFVPALWFCDPVGGVLVREFVEGEVLGESDSRRPFYRQQVGLILARLKEIVVSAPTFDYWRHLCHYRNQLVTKGVELPGKLEGLFAAHGEEIHRFQQSSWQPVLVHHDLTPANIIVHRERLVVIDWEYAAMGYAGMDSYRWLPAAEPFGRVIAAYLQLIDGYWHLLNQQP